MDLTLHAVIGFLGRLHPAVIHFPIALMAAAALFEGIQVWRRTAVLSPATPLLVTVAALAAMASSAFGLLLKTYEGTEGTRVALHGWVGLGATVMALVAAVSVAAGSSRPGAVWSARLALGVGTALVLGAGFLGGELVFGPNHLLAVFKPTSSPNLVERGPEKRVDFEREIAPILKESCLKCHGPTQQKGHLRLDREENALRGGEEGPVMVPGDRSRSRLFLLLKDQDPGSRMPQKSDPLPLAEMELLGRWIDEGARWPKGFVVR